MQRRIVCWCALGAITLAGVLALWIGYRVMGYWNDQHLLAELSTLEPTCGYQTASWGAPALRHLPQNSVLLRPAVWRIIYPVFNRVETIYLKDITDGELQRCQGIVERFSCPIEVAVIMSEKLTDVGVERLAQFKNLNGVSLLGTHRITDQGVARLCAQQSNLEVLSLDSPALTDQCIVYISQLPRLQHLTLS